MVWPFSSGDNKTENAPVAEPQRVPHRSSVRKSTLHFEPTATSTPPPPPPPTSLPPSSLPSSSSSSSSPKTDSEPRQLLLEDTEPRFNNGAAKPELPIKEAMSTISLDSFRFTNLIQIPCFREAGLTGLSALGVLGTIIFITQKSPSKAANWGIGGLLLGSTVAWEQCRSKRRKELEFAAKARETVAAKKRPMLKKPEETISEEQLKHREELKSEWKKA